jgi:hypothetical protein
LASRLSHSCSRSLNKSTRCCTRRCLGA